MKVAKEQSLVNWTVEFQSQRAIKFDSELDEIK